MYDTTETFHLHERLAADCFEVCDLRLCKVLLLNDKRYPWLVLVPRENGIREISELSENAQMQLMREMTKASKALEELFDFDKINIGALGNLVPQLHIHVMVRTKEDPAWPGPVWGHSVALHYTDGAEVTLIEKLRQKLQ